MVRGLSVSVLSYFGDAPAVVSRRVPSLGVESLGFMYGANGLPVSEETVLDLDGVVDCLAGASPECESRFGLAISLSA